MRRRSRMRSRMRSIGDWESDLQGRDVGSFRYSVPGCLN